MSTDAVRGGVARLDADSFLTLSVPDGDQPTEEEARTIETVRNAARAYFRHFADVVKRDPGNMLVGGQDCIGCGKALGGYLGTFRYSLAHGEGRCSSCGYPCRTHHYVKDDAGNEVLSVRGLLLQYHPDELRTEPPTPESEVPDVPSGTPATR